MGLAVPSYLGWGSAGKAGWSHENAGAAGVRPDGSCEVKRSALAGAIIIETWGLQSTQGSPCLMKGRGKWNSLATT